MEYKNTRRIYCNSKIITERAIEIKDEDAHYLKNVLRLKSNDYFRIFNSSCGEYLAQISFVSKSSIELLPVKRIRAVSVIKPLTLAISLIKSDKFLSALDFAVQLGVTNIIPIKTSRCNNYATLNPDRIKKYLIAGVEQSERMDMPNFNNILSLEDYILRSLNIDIIWADEDNKNRYIKDLESKILNAEQLSVLIGPEGGFSQEERKILSSKKNIYGVCLSNNILRSETALCAAIAQIQMYRKI